MILPVPIGTSAADQTFDLLREVGDGLLRAVLVGQLIDRVHGNPVLPGQGIGVEGIHQPQAQPAPLLGGHFLRLLLGPDGFG
jgi:hypothetical protein